MTWEILGERVRRTTHARQWFFCSSLLKIKKEPVSIGQIIAPQHRPEGQGIVVGLKHRRHLRVAEVVPFIGGFFKVMQATIGLAESGVHHRPLVMIPGRRRSQALQKRSGFLTISSFGFTVHDQRNIALVVGIEHKGAVKFASR